MEDCDLSQPDKEVTKHVSIGLLNPLALRTLKETGKCIVDLREPIFDMDAPGHYMRRLKTVGLTILCVSGAYNSLSCKLTLLSSKYRQSSIVEGGYPEDPVGNDPRFTYDSTPVRTVTTNQAQNDSGIFDSDPQDERYCPFEGAGVISEWMLELPEPSRQFDYSMITDVILHLNYTARDAGPALSKAAETYLRAQQMR